MQHNPIASSRSSPSRWRVAQGGGGDHARRRALRRHRRRLRRGRRHGRVPARDVGHQGAPARGRAHARPAEGVQDDGVAVQGHAAPPAAGGRVRARRGRVPHARPAVRHRARDAEVQEADVLLGQHFTRDWIADEKQNPITGTPYAWVRARVLGGKTNLWGRVSLRFSD